MHVIFPIIFWITFCPTILPSPFLLSLIVFLPFFRGGGLAYSFLTSSLTSTFSSFFHIPILIISSLTHSFFLLHQFHIFTISISLFFSNCLSHLLIHNNPITFSQNPHNHPVFISFLLQTLLPQFCFQIYPFLVLHLRLFLLFFLLLSNSKGYKLQLFPHIHAKSNIFSLPSFSSSLWLSSTNSAFLSPSSPSFLSFSDSLSRISVSPESYFWTNPIWCISGLFQTLQLSDPFQ